jgi:hypothetical protein
VPKPKVVEPARRRTVQSQQSWWEQCLPFKNPLDKPLKVHCPPNRVPAASMSQAEADVVRC